MADFEPTDEQKAIIAHTANQHARVLAGPGTGKSTTMVALLNRLLDEDRHLRVRLLTFTRAATTELADKVLDHTVAQTQRPSTIPSNTLRICGRSPASILQDSGQLSNPFILSAALTLMLIHLLVFRAYPTAVAYLRCQPPPTVRRFYRQRYGGWRSPPS